LSAGAGTLGRLGAELQAVHMGAIRLAQAGAEGPALVKLGDL